MNNKQLDNLDAWKDFVLKVIIERGEATLTDYVWDRIEQEFHLDDNNIHHFRYTDCVIPCLENEYGLIRRSGKRGIQITEKGKRVAKIGFRSYLNSLERHERIQKWNDYLGLVTGSLSIITTLVGFANMFIGWIDKFTAFIPAAILTILFAAIKFLCKTRK